MKIQVLIKLYLRRKNLTTAMMHAAKRILFVVWNILRHFIRIWKEKRARRKIRPKTGLNR